MTNRHEHDEPTASPRRRAHAALHVAIGGALALLLGTGTLNANSSYSSAEAAVNAGLAHCAEYTSNNPDRELAGTVYRNSDGSYGVVYGPPGEEKSQQANVPSQPPGTTGVAIVHSHTSHSVDNGYSELDYTTAYSNGVPVYWQEPDGDTFRFHHEYGADRWSSSTNDDPWDSAEDSDDDDEEEEEEEEDEEDDDDDEDCEEVGGYYICD